MAQLVTAMTEAEGKTPSIVKISKAECIFLSAILIVFGSLLVLSLAPDGVFKERAMSALEPVLNSVGLQPATPQFGNRIRHYNGHLLAEIVFTDGTTRICEFPRNDQLDVIEAYCHYKLRILSEQMMVAQDSDPILSSVARGLARANFDKENQPFLITLVLKWSPPAPIQNGGLERDRFRNHTKTHPMLVYHVKEGDVR